MSPDYGSAVLWCGSVLIPKSADEGVFLARALFSPIKTQGMLE